MNYLKRAREFLDIEVDALSRARDKLDQNISAAIRLMLDALQAGHKIVVTGVGKNLHIAEKISATLASTGSTSVSLNPTQAMHGDLGVLSEGDVLLALSYSGESDELLALMPMVRRLAVSIVSITGNRQSALAQCSDVVVEVAIDREACPFNMAPTASTTATLAVGDALAMVLLEARGFRREDYARLHPGGAIGRALILRVQDIMRSGDRLATVNQDASVKDALLAMTRARAGYAAVLDNAGALLGIFTDGDLRRNIPSNPNLLDSPVRDVMTLNPISIPPTALAADALRVFQDHNIDDLVVLDDNGRLVGSIDIQDLPKIKIL